MSPEGSHASSRAAAVSPLRVVLVHYSVSPVVGGVERVLDQHASLLADDGHDVTLVAGRGAPRDPRILFHRLPLVDSTHPRILDLRRDLDRGMVPAGFAATVEALFAGLRLAVPDPDLIIAHNVCSLPFNLALTAALRRLSDLAGGPLLVAWHHDLAWTQKRFRSALHVGFPWDLLRTAWPGVRHVTISEARRAELANLMGIPTSTIRVVRNGIDIAGQLALDPETEAIVARTRMLDADPLLLLPSRITPRKNIELGLEVVAHMRRSGRPAALIVTGPVDPHDPTQETHLARLLSRRRDLGLEGAVWFLAAEGGTPLPDRVMTDLYRIADALILPSREEGFGLPILEAALHRLPIICTDLPVLREVAGDAATYLHPGAEPREAAAVVLGRLEADAGEALRRRVRREYAWPEIYRHDLRPLLAEVIATGEDAASA